MNSYMICWKEIKKKKTWVIVQHCHAEPQHSDDTRHLYLSRCTGNILQLADNSSAAEQEEKGSTLQLL